MTTARNYELKELQSRCVVRIVDDDEGIRRSFRYLLEGDGWLVRSFASAEEFLDRDHLEQPGCVLLDVRMEGMSGIELQRRLNQCGGHPHILFLSAHGTIPMAVQAVKEGAVDFIPKPVDEDLLLDKVEEAARLNLALADQNAAEESVRRAWRRLSVREVQVARVLAKGLPNKVIADKLGIAERTVQLHRAHLLEKLGIRSGAELAVRMTRLGLSE